MSISLFTVELLTLAQRKEVGGGGVNVGMAGCNVSLPEDMSSYELAVLDVEGWGVRGYIGNTVFPVTCHQIDISNTGIKGSMPTDLLRLVQPQSSYSTEQWAAKEQTGATQQVKFESKNCKISLAGDMSDYDLPTLNLAGWGINCYIHQVCELGTVCACVHVCVCVRIVFLCERVIHLHIFLAYSSLLFAFYSNSIPLSSFLPHRSFR